MLALLLHAKFNLIVMHAILTFKHHKLAFRYDKILIMFYVQCSVYNKITIITTISSLINIYQDSKDLRKVSTKNN